MKKLLPPKVIPLSEIPIGRQFSSLPRNAMIKFDGRSDRGLTDMRLCSCGKHWIAVSTFIGERFYVQALARQGKGLHPKLSPREFEPPATVTFAFDVQGKTVVEAATYVRKVLGDLKEKVDEKLSHTYA